MADAVEAVPPQENGMEAAKPRRKYTRDLLLALKDNPKCRSLPLGLDSDDLSDLQESCFFDKSPTIDGPPIYLGPQRGPAGARAPFGAAARRPAVGVASPGPPGAIHSRLIEEDERGYQRTASGQLSSAFGSSPSKPQAIQTRTASGRYEDPAKMDRWDSRKMGGGGGSAGGAAAAAADDGWQQQKGRGDNWRGGGAAAAAASAGAAARGSMEGPRPGSGWGGREPQPEPARSGSSAPKDGSAAGSRWSRDDDDWRARKRSGAAPEPRYDWSDNRAPGVAAPPGGAATRGPPPGFADRDRAPEWAEEEPGQRARMTAADMEAERLRMQEQWKRQGGTASGAQARCGTMSDLMTDEDIMSMMAEEEDRQAPAARAANGAAAVPAAPPPKAGQHVDVAALLGGRPQPAGAGSEPAGDSPGAAAAAAERAAAESTRSRFASFFRLEESPAGGAAARAVPGATYERPPAAGEARQLSFEELGRGPGGAPAPTPGFAATTPAEIERRLPSPPPAAAAIPAHLQAGAAQQAAQSRDAGQALLAMLRQQQAAQAAAAGGGGPPPRPLLPPGAVSAADVSVLEEADKVARLTALQGLDEEVMGSPAKGPHHHSGPNRMQLPPGVGMQPPPHLPPGHQGPPPPGMGGFPPGQLPPGMLPMQHPGHLPPGAFPPGQLPPGMHLPPGQLPPGMQYRPPGGMQYRPPGVGLPPQPGMQHPGMPPPQLQHQHQHPQLHQQQQQQQQQQQSALLAQLLAAQANRGPPPPQQHQQQMGHGQPAQQINLAALLGGGGGHSMQLPPMPQQALSPAQLQGMQGMRPPGGGMMPPGMPPGINPALLQQLQMQQSLQRPHMPPHHLQQHPPPQQQLSSAQLMAALGMGQPGGMPAQGMR